MCSWGRTDSRALDINIIDSLLLDDDCRVRVPQFHFVGPTVSHSRRIRVDHVLRLHQGLDLNIWVELDVLMVPMIVLFCRVFNNIVTHLPESASLVNFAARKQWL